MTDRAPGGADLLAVGTIIRPHGLRGAVIVAVESDWPARFRPGSRLVLETPAGELRDTTVESSGPHRGRMLVQLEGVRDRNAAEELKGAFLLVPASDAAPLGEGEYWAHDLVGMRLVDEGDADLGDVVEVLCGEAQDTLVAKAPGGSEFRVPFVAEFVRRVDVGARVITIRPIEGMVE